MSPLEAVLATTPLDVKLNLALEVVVEICKAGGTLVVELDDGKYEIVMNKLKEEEKHDEKV